MEIQTSRFGVVQLTKEDIINFPEGVLGFGSLRKFVLLDDPNDEIFAWLQSCEEPNVAFPVLEPELFAANYSISLSKSDMEALKMTNMERSRLFTIVTIPDDVTLMTANLKAPLVINVDQRMARQCVLQDNNLAIREPIFAKLQQRIVQNPTQPIRGQHVDKNVVVRLSSTQTRPVEKA